MRKGTRLDQAIKIIDGAKETGIETVVNFILEIPIEMLTDIRKTIHFAKKKVKV